MSQQIEVYIENNQQKILVQSGSKLIDICEEFQTLIPFGCRACSCGICLIEIIEGEENLIPATDQERILLDVFAEENAHARLACQCIVNGSIKIKF